MNQDVSAGESTPPADSGWNSIYTLWEAWDLLQSWVIAKEEKGILNDNQRGSSQWVDWREAPKHVPKPKLHNSKVVVTDWWSAAHRIHCSFLSPVTPSHLRSVLSRPTRYTENCNPCSQYWQQNGPDSPQNQCSKVTVQKSNKLDCEVVPHPPYSPDLSPTDDHFFKHLSNFLQGKCFRNQQEAENTSQEFVESWNTDFLHYRNNFF